MYNYKFKKLTKNPREHHFKEVLVRYMEDLKEIKEIEKHINDKKKGKVKLYTSEEARKELTRIVKYEVIWGNFTFAKQTDYP